jgi:molecular chaperone GrpE (heat shock protein)
MLNFETELNRLLSRETGALPQYEFAELADTARVFLAELDKKQTDVSLQIEEIYDLVKEQDTRNLWETLNAEKTRANHLVFAAISLSDLLEDFCVYARQSGSEELKHQARLLRENADGILSSRGIFRFGEEGDPLNPQIHTVKASAESPLPRERVVQVLQSGYLSQNVLLRKAAVVISRGQGDVVFTTEMADTVDDSGNENNMDYTGVVDDEDDGGNEDDMDYTGGVDDIDDGGALDDTDYSGVVDNVGDTNGEDKNNDKIGNRFDTAAIYGEQTNE